MADRFDPLVLIHLFSRPPEAVDTFVEKWPAIFAPASRAPGFRGTSLYRAVAPGAPFPLVNIARWDSADAWETARSAHFSRFADHNPDPAQSALYRAVHITPDPQQ
jgi:heme-degrading monooxygenase HmoA